MNILISGWKAAFNKTAKWFIAWVNMVLLLGMITLIVYHSWTALLIVLALGLLWNVSLASLCFHRGSAEISKTVRKLTQTNGHHKRSLILFFDEKKDDDNTS